MSALPPKADMCGASRYVRSGPKADIGKVSNRAHNPPSPNEFDFSPLHPVGLVVRPQTRKDWYGQRRVFRPCRML